MERQNAKEQKKWEEKSGGYVASASKMTDSSTT